ncbi:chaperonin 10-like protein [Hyaloraphidium curvatum]|nr:chaperonin 10-like protein [Hyaloraphidium curvatum]
MATDPAVVLHGVRDLRLDQVPRPSPGPGEVLVRNRACGICGSDLHWWKGEMPVRTFPFPMGHEASGIIEAVGDGVKNLKVGDRVAMKPGAGTAMLARYSKQIAENCFVLPPHVSFEEGAFVEPLAVGLHAVKRAGFPVSATSTAPRPSNILVIGAGPIGQTVLVCAKALGAAWVGVVDKREDRLEAAAKIGADATIVPPSGLAPGETPPPEAGFFTERVPESTWALANRVKAVVPNGGAVDAVVDCVGVTETLNTALTLVKPHGAVVNVGIGAFKSNGLDLILMALKQVDLKGVFAYPEEYPEALELIASGRVDVKPLISHVMPIEDFEKGYQTALDAKAGSVKVMFSL